MFEFKIHNKDFIIDIENINYILNRNLSSTKIFDFKLNENDYPYYINKNKKKIYLIEEIMENKCYNKVKFIDGSKYNYQKNNIIILEKDSLIYNSKNLKIIDKIEGHKKDRGKSAGIIKNNIYICEKNNEMLYLLQCNEDYTLISKESIEKIKTFNNKVCTWFKMKNGYVGSHVIIDNKETVIYLHQHLMDYYGHGLSNKKETIDHINRDKLDNRMDNLRLLSQSEQNMNTGKRSRKHNAQPLPDGLTQKDLPKWVVYYREKIYPENGKYRDFFKIEKCPYSDKIICSTKSNKVSIRDKLKEIKEKLNQLTNGTYEKEKKDLPLGMYLKDNCMIFDYRDKEASALALLKR